VEASVSPGLARRTLATLLIGNMLVAIGIGFFVPILPLFLTARGGDSFLVGVVFAAGIVGRTLAQYPGGWLADRWGSRPILIASTTAYALCFPLYLLPLSPGWLIALRFVHALVSGAYPPAAAALIGGVTERSRGRLFGYLRASDMAGFFLGPTIGGLVANVRLDAIFLVGGLACLAAVPLLLLLPNSHARASEAVALPVGWKRLLAVLATPLAMAVALQWTIGTYDTVWSLYLVHRGATPSVVGLSFAAYSLPVILLAGFAGSLSDRLGHLRMAAVSTLLLGAIAIAYPFVVPVWGLVALCLVEGTFTVGGTPALQAVVSAAAPSGAQGRVQGFFQTVSSAGMVAGAVVGGALYAVNVGYPFFSVTVICALGVAVAWLRSRGLR
jgi:MFS transporter, DHA1 family, multidrug resistance protein